ncbi:MAG TPA: hypothetical protein VEU53_08490 [Stellaceae bacterium]|nr:hypothetical protein [Stellaceae bacterium]
MASKAQLAANRRNAARSTGPKTNAGKAVAARNALRHGLTAEQVVLFDETAASFAAFHAELRAAYEPADAVEEELVERIVMCAWRLRRGARAEAGLIERAMDDFDKWGIHDAGIGHAFRHAGPNIPRVVHYEAIIDRALRRAQMQLERRQAQRRGEAVPPPIAVAVAGFDATADTAEKIKIDKTKPISESTRKLERIGSALHPSAPPATGESKDPVSAGD